MHFLNGKWFNRFPREKEGEASGGGSSGGTGAQGATGDTKSAANDLASQLAEQKTRNDQLEARLKALEGKSSSRDEDKDLSQKARERREADEKTNLSQKQLESAVKFTLGAKQWLKDNATLLPKGIDGIFEQAEKENYGNAVEKDSAIKSAIITEFFSQQANVDLLTSAQRAALEEYQKLTKNVKQERAQSVYDSLFEPTFEMLKRIEKAKQLSRGRVDATDTEAAYKAKLMGSSRKHYLGEKQ